MAKFEINTGVTGAKVKTVVEARKFTTTSGFVDFLSSDGSIVYRIASSEVYTINRVES